MFTQETYSVYFGSKLIWADGKALVNDRLGSVTARVTDYSGTLNVERHDYFPYGAEMTATTGSRNKFGTYLRDASTGLDYADQRYFAGATGRFFNADYYEPSGGGSVSGSWNRYLYVEGDPTNWNDPKGLVKCQTVSATSGLGGTAEIQCTTGLGTIEDRIVAFSGDPTSNDWYAAAKAAEESWGRENERQETFSEIAPFAALAEKAFRIKSCADIFSGVDVISPQEAVNALWTRIDISFTEIVSLIGPPVLADTAGEGLRVGLKSGFPYVGTYYQKDGERGRPDLTQ